MKKTTLLFTLLLLTLSFSCKDKKKEITQMDKVMAIHDEVMPKMNTINKLATELATIINKDTTNTPNNYKKAKKDLENAHTSMMDWMTTFNTNEILDNKPLTPKKQEWLNEEEEKVEALRNQINTSIENAESLLE